VEQKAKLPDADIDVLCEKRNFEIFSLIDEMNKVYLYDKGLDLLTCLKNKYDAVIDTEQWHRLSAAVAYLTGAPVTIGFDTNERARLFTHRIPYSHDDYEVCSFYNLIEPLTGRIQDFKINESFSDIPDKFPSYFLPRSFKGDNRIISIFPGASVVERRWGGERFAKVAKILDARGYTVVILGSHAEREDAEKIKGQTPACVDLTGKTNLRDVANVLKISRLLITADSGLMHMAYAVGTPTISFFGSGIEKKWAPGEEKHIVLNKRLECSPCTRFGYTPRCKRNAECMKLITVEDVYDKAIELLKI
jgi:ADP-heptose:LPS heptosyltransferase